MTLGKGTQNVSTLSELVRWVDVTRERIAIENMHLVQNNMGQGKFGSLDLFTHL